jgi:peptidoglycan/LPS O-acetylase OafA/YrhL
MNVFAFAAVVMAVIHLVAGAQRPRVAVIVAAILWLLYAYYEHLVATGVLCDANCNIRVDLVFFFPILGLATYCAYQSYMGRPGQLKVVGTVLGVIGLFVVGLVAESFGYGDLAGVAVVSALLAIGLYAIKSRSKNQSDMTIR